MRNIFLVAAAAVISTAALAQQPQPPTEYILRLSGEEVAAVWSALGELPFKKVAPLMQKVQQQVSEQERVSPAPSPPPPAAPSN